MAYTGPKKFSKKVGKKQSIRSEGILDLTRHKEDITVLDLLADEKASQSSKKPKFTTATIT